MSKRTSQVASTNVTMTSMNSSVTRYKSSTAPLGCDGTRVFQHEYAADKSALWTPQKYPLQYYQTTAQLHSPGCDIISTTFYKIDCLGFLFSYECSLQGLLFKKHYLLQKKKKKQNKYTLYLTLYIVP